MVGVTGATEGMILAALASASTAPSVQPASAASRARSRSPRRTGWDVQAPAQGGLQQLAPGLVGPGALGVAGLGDGVISTAFEIPSAKLGQLLGLNGITIQRVKEVTGVVRLHIQDKDRAKYQSTIHIEASGTPEQVQHCQQVLEAVCSGDQTELGHLTTYVHVDRTVVGKLMGHKGQTIKELTQVTGCYIEIQQDPEQVGMGGPRLFIAGAPEVVDSAVQLIEQFVASPESRLEAVVGPLGLSVPSMQATASRAPAPVTVAPPQHQQQDLNSVLASLSAVVPGLAGALGRPKDAGGQNAALAAILSGALPGLNGGGSGAPAAPVVVKPPQAAQWLAPNEVAPLSDPTGPTEERYIEVPARFKGHLLGLHGQTIEKVRQTSGVLKCHMVEDKSASTWGDIHVQIVGPPDRVEACVALIKGIIGGDHTGIGHMTTFLNIDRSIVGKCMGHKGQTVKEMTEATGCYIEIQQDHRHFSPDGLENSAGPVEGPRLFISGEPENVEFAVQLIERFIASPGSRLDIVLDPLKSASPAWQGHQQAPPQQDPTSAALSALAQIPGLSGLAQQLAQAASAQQPQMSMAQGADRPPLANPAKLRSHPNAQRVAAPSPASVTVVGPHAGLSAGPASAGGLAVGAGVEVRVVEVPANKKGHLLGLHGQTIEKIRQTSGVKKCHLQEGRGGGNWGCIHVEIVGTAERIEHCIQLVRGVIDGNHTGIGHLTDTLPVEVHKVSRLMGHRGQVVTLLKDLTGTYLDIQQGPQPGVNAGEAQVFIAGPPENVVKARTLISEFLRMMDLMPASDGGGQEAGGGVDLSAILGSLSGAQAGGCGNAGGDMMGMGMSAGDADGLGALLSRAGLASAPQQQPQQPALTQELLSRLVQGNAGGGLAAFGGGGAPQAMVQALMQAQQLQM